MINNKSRIISKRHSLSQFMVTLKMFLHYLSLGKWLTKTWPDSMNCETEGLRNRDNDCRWQNSLSVGSDASYTKHNGQMTDPIEVNGKWNKREKLKQMKPKTKKTKRNKNKIIQNTSCSTTPIVKVYLGSSLHIMATDSSGQRARETI